ncbi:MAG: GntR family transcriptional regulator [Eubacteriaceae bacterium]|jgi:GntR family transcriptional regulator
MKWHIDSDRPVYRQLIEQTEQAIISGLFSPGEKLPSVRELASEAGVNPNTMQKALSELERSGMLHSERTSGRFITDDEDLISNMKYQRAEYEAKSFLDSMHKLGLSVEEIKRLLTVLEKERDEKDNEKSTGNEQ